MKNSIRALLAISFSWSALWLSAPVTAADGTRQPPAGVERPIRLNFYNTDVSDVLQAVSRFYKTNIVFPSQTKLPISVTVSAASTDEALQYVSAAAGLAYRQTRGVYVVATPANLRQALEPFGERTRLTLNRINAETAQGILDSALPYLTVRPAGTQLLLIGAPEDIEQARALLRDQDKTVPDDPAASLAITLKYAPCGQVAGVLKSMFPGIKADPVGKPEEPGIVAVSGPRSQVELAREAVRTVDLPTAPRAPDKAWRVYRIKHSNAQILRDFMKDAAPDITVTVGPASYSPPRSIFQPLTGNTLGGSGTGGSGGSSGGLGGAAGGAGGGSAGGSGGETGQSQGDTGSAAGGASGMNGGAQRQMTPAERSKTLVLNGDSARLDAAVALLEELDVPPIQVMVDVKVVDTSPERAEQLGLQWNWTPFSWFELPVGAEVATAFNNTRPNSFGQFSRVPWSFMSTLSAMITNKEAKLLAAPRMQVTDNDDASIFIGDTIRSQLVSTGALGGSNIQIVEFPIGIVLLVRPRVNQDGNITMHVHPAVSTITSIDPATGIPQTSSREAETTVMVKDGETVVIGGLIRDEATKTIQEVPFLSKLPLVGELFRNRNTNHRHSEVMVFITPHIVK